MKPTLNAADIELLQKHFTTKEDFKKLEANVSNIESRMVTHDQLKTVLDETKHDIIDEIARVVAKNILPVQEDHETRIEKLEAHAGLTTPK